MAAVTDWLCRSAEIFLDGHALITVLQSSNSGRGRQNWVTTLREARRSFAEADRFLQTALGSGLLVAPGFRPDAWLHGAVFPLREGALAAENNCRLYRTCLLRNPARPTPDDYLRWCEATGIFNRDVVSVFHQLNPHLSAAQDASAMSAGWGIFLDLLNGGAASFAPPTELVVPNPFEPWRSIAVPCHPPVLTVIVVKNGFRGILCLSAALPDDHRLQRCWPSHGPE